MILEREIIPGLVQNVGLNTNDLTLLVGTIVIVGKWKIHLQIHGLCLIRVAKYVRENLNLLVAISVYSYVIQVPALLVQRWLQLLVTVRKQNLFLAGVA